MKKSDRKRKRPGKRERKRKGRRVKEKRDSLPSNFITNHERYHEGRREWKRRRERERGKIALKVKCQFGLPRKRSWKSKYLGYRSRAFKY